MTQISWQYQVNNRAGGYIVTNTDWNDVAGDLRALIDQTTSSTTDNTPLPIGIDLVNDRVYISDPDSTTPEDGNHADTTLSVVGTTTLAGDVTISGADLTVGGGDLSIGSTTAGETNNIAGVTTTSGAGSNLVVKAGDATGTNQAGAYLALKPGMGTGSSSSGDILLQTAPAGSSGTSQNTAATVLTCTGAGNVVIANDLDLSDAGKITLGTGDDLQIYANASHSFIDHDGDGDLYIRARGTGEDMYIDAKDNLNLQTDSSTRLAIDSSGVVTIDSREVPGVYYGTSSRGTALSITHNGMLNIDTALNITIDCAIGDVIQYTFDTYVAAGTNIAHFLPYTLDGTTTKSMLPIGVQLFGPAFWGATEAQSKCYSYTYKTVTADVVSDEVTVGLYCNTANVARSIIDANIGFRATLTNLGPDIS